MDQGQLKNQPIPGSDPMAQVYYGGMNVAQSQREPNQSSDYLAQQVVEEEKSDPEATALHSFDLRNDLLAETQK